MTRKGENLRTVYMRVTIDGKRKYVDIGFIGKPRNGKSSVTLHKGMPNPGWWE